MKISHNTWSIKKLEGAMKIFFCAIISMVLLSQTYASDVIHRCLLENEKKTQTFVWEETGVKPFHELIVSWDAERPLNGSYLIQVSVLTSEWSPWLDYAFWGPRHQYTFKSSLVDAHVQVYQDAIEVLENNKGHGFRVRIVANENASLEGFRALHVSAMDRDHDNFSMMAPENVSVQLKVNGLSQMALPDERNSRLCSPTSTTATINFLSGCFKVSPIEFANSVVDSSFDIYGNWILNTAQASHLLGKPWHCFVTRLTSFNEIAEQLKKGYPVVVSVKGPLEGGALPYAGGHLLVVTGYDSEKGQVFCMDPAFPSDDLTNVNYDVNDFLMAWSRRKGLAYIFTQ